MSTRKVYVYPDRSYSLKPDTNPYIKDLVTALETNGTDVIRSKTAWLGVIDIFLYINKLDAVVFNWVEEVANRTMGYIQVIALLFLIPILRLAKVKIIWTVHNKVSHSPRNRSISTFFRKLLSRESDVIIAHTKENIESLGASNVLYYPHPFKVNYTNEQHEKEEYMYDVLFWGSVLPYKGIKEFLEYVHEYNCHNLRICIQGKCSDVDYFQSLKSLETKYITINNVFTSYEELKNLFRQSRTVVFTYRPESVLSSGALIESLANYKTVIGPDFGNFKDCQQEGIIYTYSDFGDLVDLLNNLKNNRIPHIPETKIDKYIKNYSWDSYAAFLKGHIEHYDELELAHPG